MSAARPAPHVYIRRLLRGEWTPANTHGVTPDFRLGQLQTGATGPTVSVTEPDESPVNGGDTGFSGLDPTGAGPTQTIAGTCEVDCWAPRSMSGSPTAQQLTYAMREEVRRIITRNFDSPAEPAFARLSYMASFPIINDEDEMLRFRVRCGFAYYVHPLDNA